MSSGGWPAFAVLIAFLAVSVWYAIYSWGAIGDTHRSAFGWFALTAGWPIPIAACGGLMALAFESSRNNCDR